MRSAKICHGWLLSMLIIALLSPLPLSSQTASNYSCVGTAQVSVDGDCQYVIDPKTLLQGDSIPDNLKVFVFDKNPSNREIVECPGTYNYSITNERNAIICWGLITLIDDLSPVPTDTIQTLDTLECAQIDKVLNNPNTIRPFVDGQPNPYYLGEVQFEENCVSCNCELTVKFFDQVDFFACDSLPYFAKITRRWTASDCENNLTQVEQYFHLVRPSFDALHLIPDQEVVTCSPEEVIIPDQYPFWIDVFGDTLYLNELDCNLDIQLIDEINTDCGGLYNELNRQVQIFDWCTGDTSIVDSYLIRYGDLEAPLFTRKAINLPGTNTLAALNTTYLRTQLIALGQQGKVTELSTGPMDCTISFPLDQDFLQQQFDYRVEDCSTSRYSFGFYSFEDSGQWRYSDFNTPQSTIGTAVQNIPPGMHAMVIEADDECENKGKGLLFFFVRDRIAPLAKCPEELTVTIQAQQDQGYYQWLSIEEVDQNSDDNCQLDRREMRRSVAQLDEQLSDFIALGYDSDQNGRIDQADYFDTNQNGQQDPEEYNWTLENGKWYTPWTDRLAFFCSDLSKELEIQARFFDQAIEPLTGTPAPNVGQCWVDLTVQDTSRLSIAPLNNLQLDCSDPIVGLLEAGSYVYPEDSSLLNSWRQELGYPDITGNLCGQYTVREVINKSLDNCGFGEISRTIIVEKPMEEGIFRESTEQKITIRERYDYWIKFPKDIQANCSAGIVDSGYLEVEEEHCDLLAVAYNDTYLYAPQDVDACFKIFRTYQVINWCEYNGRSAPLIISRDWDNWNGESCGTNYNMNPNRPDGNNQPGDNDLFVIVHRNFNDELPDTVYYDADSNPYNSFPDNPETPNQTEAYWWKVISGPGSPESNTYYQTPLVCGNTGLTIENVWGENIEEGSTQADEENNPSPRFGSFGYWQYTQHLLVYDDIYPEVEISGSPFICGEMTDDCLVEVELGMIISDQCIGSNDLKLEIWFDENRNGQSLVDYSVFLEDTLFKARFPLGSHQLVLWADDNCGNRVRQIFNLTINDCTAPQPICRPGRIVELMADGNGGAVASALAADFLETAVYDCAGQGPEEDSRGRLRVNDFSINLKDQSADRSQTSLNFNCQQLSEPEFLVEIHAWDENDQHGFCESIISIKDTENTCPFSSGMIAGTILTEDNRFIQNADVSLSGPLSMLYLSDENGKYAFDQIETNTDYTVSPSLNSGFLNGISTWDILIIQNHILGRQVLDSPYKRIAADVNNSKAISTLDLIELRKLILSVDLRFENNTSWRFIPADYRFPNPQNPWQTSFPEIININNLADSLMSVDFVGVKIGDVSGNVDPASTLSIDERSQTTTSLQFTDRFLSPDQIYTIPIKANLEQIQGMQFTLQIDQDKADLLEVTPGAFAKNNYRIQANRGWIATSWLQTEASGEDLGKEICFHLVLKPKKELRLSEVLSLTDHWVKSEAYADDRVKSLLLQSRGEVKTKETFLFEKVYPNPFRAETRIVFYNPIRQKLNIQLYTLSGQLLWQSAQQYESGKQVVPIFGKQLPGKGIYLVKIRSAQNEQTRRIVYH
ncbi:MAG TPA: T9SS type A sorting domain-containing protein [Saprospiraceae bacterium]|nr:T9SS type A sorting domain-containing protein [Saprospiraceae bacterium]